MNVKTLCWTLRSWVHEILSQYRTVSPRLGDNCLSKCLSNSFPHTKYMSPCVENCQNHTLMFCCSLIPGRRFEKKSKLMGHICPTVFSLHFITFSAPLETIDALQCNSDSFPLMVICILCVENFQNYIWTHSCLPIAGRLFYIVRKFHWPRIWECNIYFQLLKWFFFFQLRYSRLNIGRVLMGAYCILTRNLLIKKSV